MENTIRAENTPLRSVNPTTSLVILVWLVILLQRIGILISGFQLSVGMLLFFVFVCFWIITKKIFINRKRFLYFLAVLTGILIATSVSLSYSTAFSIQSLLVLITLYSFSVFTLVNAEQTNVLKHFCTIMFIFSLVGILQFAIQLMGVPYRDWLDFIPADYVIRNYNFAIPLTFGHYLYKSNGLFFSEPSFFSQMLALAIIIELHAFRKYWRLFFLLPALLFTFSGTGLILLAVGLVQFLFSRRMRAQYKVISLASIILFLVLFSFSSYQSYLYDRVSEFQRPNTSGYMRFISPITSYQYFFQKEGNTAKFWFGLGPGASDTYAWQTLTTQPPFYKLVIEYGLPAGLFFFLYLVFIFFFSGQPFWLSLSAFIMYAALSGSLLTPQIVVFYYIILIYYQGSTLPIQN